MTGEANAAVEGAFAGGATRVVVSDSHWFMRNIAADELHPGAELVSGGPRRLSMMDGIDGGFGMKQLAARVDLQIRRVGEGSAKVADRLRR